MVPCRRSAACCALPHFFYVLLMEIMSTRTCCKLMQFRAYHGLSRPGKCPPCQPAALSMLLATPWTDACRCVHCFWQVWRSVLGCDRCPFDLVC